MIKKILASAVLIGATFCTLPAHAQFQDNSIRYWNSDAFREPDTNLTGTGTNPFDPSEGKTAHNIMKNVISFTHVDGGNKFGDNFVNMDILKSNAGDPTAAHELLELEPRPAVDSYDETRRSAHHANVA